MTGSLYSTQSTYLANCFPLIYNQRDISNEKHTTYISIEAEIYMYNSNKVCMNPVAEQNKVQNTDERNKNLKKWRNISCSWV